MKPAREKKVQLSVNFADRNLARPLLEDLGRDRALSVNILRGRITHEEASFQIEVTGSTHRVDDLLRVSSKWGALVRTLSSGVA
jgi:hypothetical protein